MWQLGVDPLSNSGPFPGRWSYRRWYRPVPDLWRVEGQVNVDAANMLQLSEWQEEIRNPTAHDNDSVFERGENRANVDEHTTGRFDLPSAVVARIPSLRDSLKARGPCRLQTLLENRFRSLFTTTPRMRQIEVRLDSIRAGQPVLARLRQIENAAIIGNQHHQVLA